MSQFSSQFPLEALQRSPRQKKHGDSTWSCTLLCQPTWNGMLVWFEQITKFESKQWNMTGMLPAISNYYHHLWVFLSHLCLWSWLCHVNHQSLKGSTCRRFYRHFVCVGCHSVWSRWRSALKTRNNRCFCAPTWDWCSHSWIWTKPCFLTNNIHVVVTSWNIFQHLNKQIARNFRWIFGSVALDHWADFFPIDGLRDFLFTFTFHHCILKQISLFWTGNLCTTKIWLFFFESSFGDPKQC